MHGATKFTIHGFQNINLKSIITGDKDVVKPEHAVAMYRMLPNARLAILPSTHADYIGELLMDKKYHEYPKRTAAMIQQFLDN